MSPGTYENCWSPNIIETKKSPRTANKDYQNVVQGHNSNNESKGGSPPN